jgi:hypothetical protein
MMIKKEGMVMDLTIHKGKQLSIKTGVGWHTAFALQSAGPSRVN